MTLGEGLLTSTDGGERWQSINMGLGEYRWYTFEVKREGSDLFAAQWKGIYRSADGGGFWSLLPGLPENQAFTVLENTKLGLLAGKGLD